MPDGGLVVSVIIKFKEDTVRVDDFFPVEPGGKDLVFEELFVGVSDWPDEEKWGDDGVNEANNSRGSEESAFPGEFGLDEVVEFGDVIEGLD